MSKYLLNKFLYTVDRDPDLVERYRTDPPTRSSGGRARWPTRSSTATRGEKSTWLAFSDEERSALVAHDHVALFEHGRPPVLDPHPVHRDVRA